MVHLFVNGNPAKVDMVTNDITFLEPRALDGYTFDYATTYVYLPNGVNRRQGIYRFQSAEATLLYDAIHPKGSLRMTFKKLADAKMMVELIFSGKLWPEVNFEVEQRRPLENLRYHLTSVCEIIRIRFAEWNRRMEQSIN